VGKSPAEKVGEVRRIRWVGRHTYFTAFSPDSRYYLATGQVQFPNTVRVWEVATGWEVLVVPGNEAAAFTPNGKLLLAPGADKSLHLWDVATGKEVRRFPGHRDWLGSPVISPDGKLVLSCSNDQTVRLWNLETGKELMKAEPPPAFPAFAPVVRFSPDGKRFLTFYNAPGRGMFRLWDVATRREIHSWERVGSHNNCLVGFLAGGKEVVSLGGDSVLRWWDVASGKVARSLKLGVKRSNGSGLSNDGRRLIYSSLDDHCVHLIDLPSGKEVARFEANPMPYLFMSFSPDGRYAAGASADGWVYLWRLPAPPAAKGKP
jgi:WD40 repeat protein